MMAEINPNDVLAILKEVLPLVKQVSRMHGVVHKRVDAEINGMKGFLVWDFILYNEITFDDMEGNIFSFFNSFSDEETEIEWNKLVKMYSLR